MSAVQETRYDGARAFELKHGLMSSQTPRRGRNISPDNLLVGAEYKTVLFRDYLQEILEPSKSYGHEAVLPIPMLRILVHITPYTKEPSRTVPAIASEWR